MIKISQILTLCPAIFLAGCISPPNNYEDCMLNHISGKTDEHLLEAIDAMCTLKFEAKKPTSVSIPINDALFNIDGHIDVIKKVSECSECGNKVTTLLEGYAYNGSEKWVITELVISIKFSNEEKKYKVVPYYSSLPPLTKRNFVTEIEDSLYEKIKNGDYEWRFSEAYGYPDPKNKQN